MQKTKFLIVGQGLAGSLLSYSLHKKDISHLVVSSLTTPVASLVAAGMYNPLVFKRLTKSWMVDELLPIMNNAYKDIEQIIRKNIIHDMPIAKLIHTNEKESWLNKIKEEKLSNYFSEFVNASQLSGVKKEFEVAKIKHSGYVNLNELILGYYYFIKRNKQLIVADFNTKDIEFNSGKVIWKGIEAEKIIFCEGASAIKNPWFPKNVFSLTKGDIITCAIEGLSEEYIINKEVFILPKGNSQFVIGSTYIHDDLSTTPKKIDENYLLEKAQLIINSKIKVLDHRAGVRPTVKDRRPILGFHNEHSNIAFFNGLDTKGVMLGPYFANEMAKLLLEKNYQVLPEVSINRFY